MKLKVVLRTSSADKVDVSSIRAHSADRSDRLITAAGLQFRKSSNECIHTCDENGSLTLSFQPSCWLQRATDPKFAKDSDRRTPTACHVEIGFSCFVNDDTHYSAHSDIPTLNEKHPKWRLPSGGGA